MVYLVVHSVVDTERVYVAAVESFYQAIGLQMVGCCLGILDAQQVAQGGPQGGSELGTLQYDVMTSESAHPPLKQS